MQIYKKSMTYPFNKEQLRPDILFAEKIREKNKCPA
jgi:hypothetical protein